jgi:hypothetical protein
MVVSEVIKNFRPKIPPPRNPLPPGAGKNLSLEGHGAPPMVTFRLFRVERIKVRVIDKYE